MLAVLFLALHLPYLPASLEDLDSINFALGVRQFDVTHHQPHPPGYPVYIAIAKAVHAAGPAETTALALVSAAGGALGVLAIAALFRRLDGEPAPPAWPVAGIALAITSPLYWFTAVRPLSDTIGLAAAIAVQVMTLAAASTRGLAVAAFCAGLATGLRSQVLWLTAPLLIARALGTGEWRLNGPRHNPQSLLPVVAAFATGIAVWFVPLMVMTGGPAAYSHALVDQGAEDLGNIQMLWNNHSPRDLRDAAYYALVAPWAAWPLAALVLASAAGGVVSLARGHRRALSVLAVAFVPYFVFDVLFQETFTGRYALPLVVPIAYLAVAGLRVLPWDMGLALTVAIAMFSAHVGGTSIAAYARAPAPAFRLLGQMSASATLVHPVLAMDRREGLDLRRPLQWAGDGLPAGRLPFPPQHEWLEAVKYWNGGGRAPVWFVVDPTRASIDLVQHGAPVRFRWPLPYPVLLSGVRPNEMDWYRVDRPEWYVGEGWSLTPEAAGVAAADGRLLARGSIDGWIQRGTGGGTLMIGGRSFDPALRPRLTVSVDRRPLIDETLMPGAFLRFVSLPLGQSDTNVGDYAAVTVAGTAGAQIAIEQFDASSARPLLGFGDGWHEQELDPRTGARWRWLSERGELRWRAEPRAIPRGPLTLHLEGESPRTYFPRGSRLVLHSGDRIVFDRVLAEDFSLDVPLEHAADTIVLETDQTYIPAERSRRTRDRRHLGLRIFKAELRAQN